MNTLPKTVARQRRDCDLNPDPSALQSSALTTRLPSRRDMGSALETTTCSSESATVLVASLLLYVVFFDLNRFSSMQ